MSILSNTGIRMGASGAGGDAEYQGVAKSLRFNDDDSAYLNWTPSGDGSTATWTLSFWIKRGNLPGSNQYLVAAKDGSNYFELLLNSSDKLAIYNYIGSGAALSTTDRLFRDCSAFYHIVYTYDTSQSGDDKLKLYVNGTQETSFSTDNRSSTGASYWNTATVHTIGSSTTPHNHFDGLISDVNFVDGTALDASSFAEEDETTGQWVPKEYTGSYGTNGFYLKFDNTSDLGEDSSGNDNDWTANNLSTTAGAGNDVLADSPSTYDDSGNGVGNYCTWNPLHKGNGTLSNGNLEFVGDNSWLCQTHGTIGGLTSGKWYYEMTLLNDPSNQNWNGETQKFGWTSNPEVPGSYVSTDWLGFEDTGWYRNFGSQADSSTTMVSGGVISISVDLDANTFNFRYNNSSVLSGTIGGTAGRALYPFHMSYSGSNGKMAANFGQRAFEYTPPTGYKALNTFNLDDPTIADPSDHFNVKLYDGDDATSNPITELGFSPDFVWIKNRDQDEVHVLKDTVRGVESALYSNSNSAEDTGSTYSDRFPSFDADGFTVGSTHTGTNSDGDEFVAWCWNAGSEDAETNDDGSIDSEVKANTTTGFSIVKWEGQGAATNIGHGLNAVPGLIISKCLDSSQDWNVWHTGLGANSRMFLNTNVDAESGGYPTVPTSSIFYVDNTGNFPSGEDIISYVWSEVEGYSKISQYTSSGGTDNFIYTGFRPAFLIAKRVVSSADNTYEGWIMFDSKRGAYNINDESLYANETHTEGKRGQGSAAGSTFGVDFLSNGFSFYDNATEYNRADEEQYIYYAVAETPFKYSNAR